MSTQLTTLDLATLSTITGGNAQTPQQPRTWGQVATQYGAACAVGAGQALLAGGRPTSWQGAAATAAWGCATGVVTRGIEDLSRVGGQPG
jgi:hypothetical protein